eukprot:16200451-Heterocapsa_arctica.AAC.1
MEAAANTTLGAATSARRHRQTQPAASPCWRTDWRTRMKGLSAARPPSCSSMEGPAPSSHW